MAISMLKIRRPLGRLIFNMGIAIPGKTVFLIETAPCKTSSRATFKFWWSLRGRRQVKNHLDSQHGRILRHMGSILYRHKPPFLTSEDTFRLRDSFPNKRGLHWILAVCVPLCQWPKYGKPFLIPYSWYVWQHIAMQTVMTETNHFF